MAVIPILIDALGTITKRLVQGLKDLEIRGRAESIETTALLSSTRILRRVLETWEDLSLKLHWKTISLRLCEKLSRNTNNNATVEEGE